MAISTYENVYIEKTVLSPCIDSKTEPNPGEKLIEETVTAALEAVGENRDIPFLVVTTHTGNDFYPNIDKRIVKELKNAGIKLSAFVTSRPSKSNSQPAAAEAAFATEKIGCRSLLVAIEPLNIWPTRERTNQIIKEILGQGDRKHLKSMLEGLNILTERYLEKFQIPHNQFREAIRRLSLRANHLRSSNPESQHNHKPFSEKNYDDPQINKQITPLFGLYDCCPTTTRSSATVLNRLEELNQRKVLTKLEAITTVEDKRTLKDRLKFRNYPKEEAGFRAFEELTQYTDFFPADFKQTIFEIHDAVRSLIAFMLVETGYINDPRAVYKKLIEMPLDYINPTGGLANGHPLSATYPSILKWVQDQFENKAGSLQLNPVNAAIIQSVWGLRDKISFTYLKKV